MSLAAIAAGADGLEIEVHIDPPSALSDKDQQLTPTEFAAVMKRLDELREFMAERAEADAESARKGDAPAAGKGPGNVSAQTVVTRAGASRDPFADAMD